jgi:hypothetical protein
MTQSDCEFSEFVRLSLYVAIESVVVRPDGLDRIRARLGAEPPRALVRREHAGRPVLARRAQHRWADCSTPE